jgi:hypothetical protein
VSGGRSPRTCVRFPKRVRACGGDVWASGPIRMGLQGLGGVLAGLRGPGSGEQPAGLRAGAWSRPETFWCLDRAEAWRRQWWPAAVLAMA